MPIVSLLPQRTTLLDRCVSHEPLLSIATMLSLTSPCATLGQEGAQDISGDEVNGQVGPCLCFEAGTTINSVILHEADNWNYLYVFAAGSTCATGSDGSSLGDALFTNSGPGTECYTDLTPPLGCIQSDLTDF